jgi:hypothetical protein
MPELMSSDTPKVNVYSCQVCEHDFVTVDRDEGVTPMFMTCRVCGGRMVSAMYRCDQTRIPTHEWLRPSRAQIKGYPKHERVHFRQGGLDIREIAP